MNLRPLHVALVIAASLAAACGGANDDGAASDTSAIVSAPTEVASLSAPTLIEHRSTPSFATTGYPQPLYHANLNVTLATDAQGKRIASIRFLDADSLLDLNEREVRTPAVDVGDDGSFSVDFTAPVDETVTWNFRERFVLRWTFRGSVADGKVTLTQMDIAQQTLASRRNPRTGTWPEDVSIERVLYALAPSSPLPSGALR